MEKQRGVRFGLAKKLTIYFLILSLIPIMIIGTTAFLLTRNQLKNRTKAHLSDLARDCGKKISYYVNARYQDIRLLSQADVFEGNDVDAMQKYIENSFRSYEYYDAISVIDKDGSIIACTRREFIDQSKADHEWFRNTIQCKQNEVIQLDAYRSGTAGYKIVIGFNAPITDKNNIEIIRILTTRVSMDHIISRVQNLDERTGSGNHAYLLNKNGEIIAGQDEEEFLTTYRLYDYPIVKDLLAGKTGITEYKNDRGEDVISARYVLQGEGNFAGWGWGIIVTLPISIAYKSAYDIRNATIILSLITVLLVVIFAVFVSRGFSRPIVQVSKAALQITRGNLEPTEIKYGSKDEVGDLVDAFNKMTKDLQKITVTKDKLENEITERKKAEKRIDHLNSVLKAIRNVNQLIIKEKDRDSLLQKTCEILIEARGYDAAWLGFLKDDKTFAMVKGAGFEKNVNRFSEYVMKGEHPLCIKNALAEKISLVVIDKSKECGDCFFEDACVGKEAAIIRVEYASRFFGLLAILFAPDVTVDEEEKNLLKEVAGDIAFALYSMEIEQARNKAEQERERLNVEFTQKNKELEQIVYTTSHDLRSPLVNIQGFSNELNESIKEIISIIKNNKYPATVKEKIGPLLEQDIPESLQYILTSVAKMDSLLNGLLKLSRLGRAALKPEKIDMDKLINNVINAFEFKIKESDVKLEIFELPPCKADKTQIDQVFSNLMDNALKYLNSKRQGIIRISGYKENTHSVYCVEDNGIGIDPKHQEIIFTIFHQLNPDRVLGQGVGLTIVRRILDRHGGKIWVKSELGKGSKFYVSLPGG